MTGRHARGGRCAAHASGPSGLARRNDASERCPPRPVGPRAHKAALFPLAGGRAAAPLHTHTTGGGTRLFFRCFRRVFSPAPRTAAAKSGRRAGLPGLRAAPAHTLRRPARRSLQRSAGASQTGMGVAWAQGQGMGAPRWPGHGSSAPARGRGPRQTPAHAVRAPAPGRERARRREDPAAWATRAARAPAGGRLPPSGVRRCRAGAGASARSIQAPRAPAAGQPPTARHSCGFRRPPSLPSPHSPTHPAPAGAGNTAGRHVLSAAGRARDRCGRGQSQGTLGASPGAGAGCGGGGARRCGLQGAARARPRAPPPPRRSAPPAPWPPLGLRAHPSWARIAVAHRLGRPTARSSRPRPTPRTARWGRGPAPAPPPPAAAGAGPTAARCPLSRPRAAKTLSFRRRAWSTTSLSRPTPTSRPPTPQPWPTA
jgi:hypothetical protein